MTSIAKKKISTETMVLGAVLTALVIILQLMGSFIRFGPFSVSLVLIPIVIGAATCGVGISTWLGFVFGLVVLFNGEASLYLGLNFFGAIFTVIGKGVLCGLFTALVYKLLEKYNRYFSVVVSAIVCPIVNTGVFILGCYLFFFEKLMADILVAGFSGNSFMFVIMFYVGANFLFELGTNIVLSPVVVRLLNIRKK